jgi:hypothetical protein
MADGPQALTTTRLALAFETAGARAAAPTIYIIAGGKVSPTSTKGTTKRRVAGNRDPVLSTRTPETFKVSIPLPALIESNGLGEMLLATFGTDTCSTELGSSTAYDHVFTANDTIKTFTLWLYDTLDTQSIRMCTVDQMQMVIDKNGSIEFVFDITGTDMVSSSTFGTPSYVNVATDKPKLIPPAQTILEYGNPQANVQNYWEKITITSKENPAYGAIGKAPVPAGSGSPRLVVKGERDVTMEIEYIDVDGVERKRWRQGGDTVPTATAQADVQALTKFRVRCFGNQTKAATSSIWSYPHQANAGTVTATGQGTYTGLSGTPAMYEVKCTTAAAQDKIMWRKDGGAWSADVNSTDATPITLSDGVTFTPSAKTGMAVNDTWFIFSHYQRMIEFTSPTNVIEDHNFSDSTDFYKAKISLYHESGVGGTKASMTLRNTKTPAYS